MERKFFLDRFRVDFYNNSLHGYVFDRTRYFYNLSFRELYKFLVRYAKDHSNPDLLAIYICKEYGGNVFPIFSIHIGEHIFVEDYKTKLCAMVK